MLKQKPKIIDILDPKSRKHNFSELRAQFGVIIGLLIKH